MSVVWNMDRVQLVEVLTGECRMEHGPCTISRDIHWCVL